MGIRRDERAEYVLAAEHDEELTSLLQFARRIAFTTPRACEWGITYRELLNCGYRPPADA